MKKSEYKKSTDNQVPPNINIKHIKPLSNPEITDQLIRRKKELLQEIEDREREIIEIDQLTSNPEEISIQATRSQFMRLLHTIDFIILHINGKIIFANHTALKYLGISDPEQLINRSILDFIPDKKTHHYFTEPFQAEPESEWGKPFEITICKNEEELLVFEFISANLDYNGQKSVLSIGRDITEQKKNLEELSQREEMYQKILETLTDAIYSSKVSDTYEIGIRSEIKDFHNKFGYSKEDLVKFQEFKNNHFTLEEDHPLIKSAWGKLISEKKTVQFEHRLLHKDSSIRWVRHIMIPRLDNQGNTVSFDGLIQDITESKLARERERRQELKLIQADKMVSLGVLVSGVAHEINNPANFILFNAPLLKRAWEVIKPVLDMYVKENGDFNIDGILFSKFSKSIPALLEGINDGGQRIKRIVDDLKNYARHETGEQKGRVDINKVVESAVKLLEVMVRKATNDFSVEFYPKPLFVNGNHQRLEQVVINLIQNACQALTSRDQPIKVKTVKMQDEKHVAIIISDRGVGIKPEHLNKLTDPFFTTKRESGGTGLGLSVSAGIIADHEGKLQFESQLGEGTTVTVILNGIDHE